MDRVRVGIINTGWWADAMYLPALTAHPKVDVVAACGRNVERSEAFVARWGIPNLFTNYREMIGSGLCDAVIVAASHNVHYEMTMAVLEAGLHVLCEKPLARNAGEAAEMAALAAEKGVKTCVPFTYRFMPHNRFMKQLIDDGFIGRPYHLNFRYYHAFGREAGYKWSWDVELTGGGDVANLGSHPLYIAYWYFGRIESVMAELSATGDRGYVRPDGSAFTQADDNGILALRFENGATGVIHYSSMSYETSPFEQQHFYDVQGSNGSLYHTNNWLDVQETIGAQVGEEMRVLDVPDEIWGHANVPGNVHESYKAVFRKDLLMVGEWIDGILGGAAGVPDFGDGLHVQRVIDAAIVSSREGRRVRIDEI